VASSGVAGPAAARQHVAQFGEEKLVIGTLGRARFLPAGDECGGIGRAVRDVVHVEVNSEQ